MIVGSSGANPGETGRHRDRGSLHSTFLVVALSFLMMVVLPLVQSSPSEAGPAAALAAQDDPGQVSEAAQEPEVHVKARMIAARDALSPGETVRLGVLFQPDPHWHIYYKDPGESGMPTQIQWQLPDGYSAGELLWEKPKRFDENGIVTYGYDSDMVLAADVSVPASARPGSMVKLNASLKWLSCKEMCIPGEASVTLELPVRTESTESKDKQLLDRVGFSGSLEDLDNDKASSQAISVLDADLNIDGDDSKSDNPVYYFAFAMLGGLILNLMPCVLPVIAIKVMSFLEQADEDPARVRLLGVTFSAGIISAFLVLAGIVVAVSAAGQTVGWGFQFQYPGFIIAMCVIVLLLALSLFGLFFISFSPGQDKLDKLSEGEGLAGTFFKGVLATTLSTPCTAPFLGTALGFAFAQSSWIVFGTFFSIGLGMSLPYLVLCAQPKWMKFLPKPGAWMEKFKESMGFVLLGTVIWLLSILGSQVGSEGVMWTSFFLLGIGVSAWIVGSFTDLGSETPQKIKIWALALVLSSAAFYLCVFKQPSLMTALKPGQTVVKKGVEESGLIKWQPFTVKTLNENLAAGKTVFIDFTAEWCLNCKTNETVAINTQPVADRFEELGVVPLKADWTSQDPDITKMLRKFKRSGVPLYVVFPGGDSLHPIQLPDGLISQQQVLESLEKAGPSKSVR